MEISVRYKEDITIFDLWGELVGDARFDFNKILREELDKPHNKPQKGIIINLKEVPMIDSVGLGIFVAAYTTLTKQSQKLVLLNVGRSIRYLLITTKLNQIFEKYYDEEEAIESFKE
ncbi:MAG: STAS domain-containing protein [Candidatus Pacebacteria bacterium]|nr:STAS domain-containing protein [Candidatus Paceibacterota bacterium]